MAPMDDKRDLCSGPSSCSFAVSVLVGVVVFAGKVFSAGIDSGATAECADEVVAVEADDEARCSLTIGRAGALVSTNFFTLNDASSEGLSHDCIGACVESGRTLTSRSAVVVGAICAAGASGVERSWPKSDGTEPGMPRWPPSDDAAAVGR